MIEKERIPNNSSQRKIVKKNGSGGEEGGKGVKLETV